MKTIINTNQFNQMLANQIKLFDNAKISNNEKLDRVKITDCNFTNCDFQNSQIIKPELMNVTFTNCTFSNIIFTSTIMKNVTFKECTFESSRFEHSKNGNIFEDLRLISCKHGGREFSNQILKVTTQKC